MAATIVRRRAQRDHIPAVISAHNLQLRYLHGDVAVDHEAGDIADAGDPQAAKRARKISRMHVLARYDILHRRGAIGDEQRKAAEKYAALREAEVCAFASRPVIGTGGGNAWQKGHPIMSQVQAATSLRIAHEALGRSACTILAMLVMENLSPEQIGERMSVDKKKAMGWVDASLTRLAEHFGMLGDDPNNPRNRA